MGLKNALNDAWMKQQQALNEQNKTMQMLNEQLKMQSKQIAVVNKTLLAILEEKE
jgi:hypothetical protein